MRNIQPKSLSIDHYKASIDLQIKNTKREYADKKFWNYQTKQIIEINDRLEPKAMKNY